MPRGAQDSVWSEAKVEELRELWASGISAGEIAKQLGRGITRNAVIGKAHRLKLERRVERQAAAPRRYPTQRRKRVLSPRLVLPDWPPRQPKPPAPPPEPPRPRPHKLTLFELRSDSCRWPAELDNPKTFWDPTTHFCGATALEGQPYCAAHFNKAHPKLRTGG